MNMNWQIVAIIFTFSVSCSKASLMASGRGILGAWGSHREQLKPWDSRSRSHPQYYYEIAAAEEQAEKQRKKELHTEEDDLDGGRPCVGLCYYKKLLELKAKEDRESDSNQDEEDLEEEIIFEPLVTDKPCVGLCQYYRKLDQEEQQKNHNEMET